MLPMHMLPGELPRILQSCSGNVNRWGCAGRWPVGRWVSKRLALLSAVPRSTVLVPAGYNAGDCGTAGDQVGFCLYMPVVIACAGTYNGKGRYRGSRPTSQSTARYRWTLACLRRCCQLLRPWRRATISCTSAVFDREAWGGGALLCGVLTTCPLLLTSHAAKPDGLIRLRCSGSSGLPLPMALQPPLLRAITHPLVPRLDLALQQHSLPMRGGCHRH